MSVLKNHFFSNASHKLRTPLSLIGGPITEVLENEEGLSEEGRNLLTLVQRNAREMYQMVNQMLKFDNNSNFYEDGGLDKDSHVIHENGEIEDSNAKNYIEDVALDSAEEFEKGE